MRISDWSSDVCSSDLATLQFLHSHIAERGADAETAPFTVQQIQELFLGRLVIDYDYVFCLTTTKTRSAIFENAPQASFAILGEYRPLRAAARSEGRRVGKECVSTCRSRGSP